MGHAERRKGVSMKDFFLADLKEEIKCHPNPLATGRPNPRRLPRKSDQSPITPPSGPLHRSPGCSALHILRETPPPTSWPTLGSSSSFSSSRSVGGRLEAIAIVGWRPSGLGHSRGRSKLDGPTAALYSIGHGMWNVGVRDAKINKHAQAR